MKNLIKKLLPFYSIVALFLIVTGIFLISMSKVDSHLAVNGTHSEIQDFFFHYFTHIGDGLTLIVLTFVISLLYKNWKNTLLLGVANLILVGIVVYVLKQYVFHDALRPSAFLAKDSFYMIPGLKLNIANSFPSGHSTASFAFFSFLAFLLYKNKFVQIGCGLMASLAAYSRVYLSQHFLEDIFLGGILGIGCFAFVYLLFKNRFPAFTTSNS